MSFTTSKVPVSLWLLLVYLFLAALSLLIQHTFTNPDLPSKYQQSQLIEFDGEFVDVSFYVVGDSITESAAFYFPDIYHDEDFLLPIAESDTTEKTRIILRYPYKTKSGNEISASAESRAKISSILIDSLKIDHVSVRGHGYGGIPAVNLVSEEEERHFNVKNLVLLSSFGVQELQFLGNYSFNRSLYTILHGVLSVSEYVIPHMGYFYQQPFQTDYSNSLLQMDQRGFRDQLKELDLPVLIVHPVNDNYVSPTISQETHRLIPQSLFVSPEGNHQLYFSNPGSIVNHFIWFQDIAQNGTSLNRENAPVERIEKSMEDFNPESIQNPDRGTLLLLGFMVVLIATMSEDLGAISAGLLVASGLLPYWFAILVTITGIFIVDVSIFLMGKYVGRPVIEKVPFRWFIKEKDVMSAENTFNMRGIEIIFLARFLPGARLPVYLVAGILKVNFTFFLTYFLLAISIWAPLLIWLSAFVGEPILSYINTYQNYALWVFLGLMFILYLFVKLFVPLTTLKGRQRLIIKWRRFVDKFS